MPSDSPTDAEIAEFAKLAAQVIDKVPPTYRAGP